MIRRTAVVLGINSSSLDRLRARLSDQGFEVIDHVPPYRLRSVDVVIAAPAYETPEMAEFVTRRLRRDVGPDVPVLLLSELTDPSYGPPGTRIVTNSISAIADEVRELVS